MLGMRGVIAGAMAIVGAAGCVLGGDDIDDLDGGQITPTGVAAVLFVVDDSLSMAEEQLRLAAAFGSFVTAADASNAARVDAGEEPIVLRVAVASSSISLTYDTGSGRTVQNTYNIPGGFDCQSGYDLSTGAPYPNGALLAAPGNETILDSSRLDSAELVRQFRENVLLGVCGSAQEQGLLAMRRALETNPSLVRSGDTLVVVFLTDEEDCSDPDGAIALTGTSDVCTAQAALPDGGQLGPVREYAELLRSRTQDVVVGAIVSADESGGDLAPSVCTDTICEARCTNSGNPRGHPCYCGGQSPGSRYLDLAAELGAPSFGFSICDGSYEPAMGALHAAVFGS